MSKIAYLLNTEESSKKNCLLYLLKVSYNNLQHSFAIFLKILDHQGKLVAAAQHSSSHIHMSTHFL